MKLREVFPHRREGSGPSGFIWVFFECVGHEAPLASHRTNLGKTLIQSLTMWLIFLVLGPAVVWLVEEVSGLAARRFAFVGQREIGAALFVLCWMGAWSSAYFLVTRGEGTPLPAAAPRRFVVAGPYRYVRNPMAMASLGQGFAIGLILGSPLIFVYTFIGCLSWNYIARPWEEFDLQRRFGEDYECYRKAVRCWIPRLVPYCRMECGSDPSS